MESKSWSVSLSSVFVLTLSFNFGIQTPESIGGAPLLGAWTDRVRCPRVPVSQTQDSHQYHGISKHRTCAGCSTEIHTTNLTRPWYYVE